MNESNIDFYDLCLNGADGGCCLVCPEAHPGCLCFECKCRKCFYYTYDGNDSGHCDIAKSVWKERIQQREEMKGETWKKDSEKLKEHNKKIEQELKEGGKITSSYTCQKCKREFTTKEEFKIVLNRTPICRICSGGL